MNICLFTLILSFGAVDKTIEIQTVPPGCLVMLNDEELGNSPVITSFEWYGDYRVRLTKSGYKTLVTHTKINRPIDDYFPVDILATIWPGRIQHKTVLAFTLEPTQPMSRSDILECALSLRSQISDFNSL